MNKFTFEYQDEENTKTLTVSFECGTWYEALDEFVKFLRGCGYALKDNSVGINESAGHILLEDVWFSNVTTFEQE